MGDCVEHFTKKSKNTVQMSSPKLSSLCQLSVAVSKASAVDLPWIKPHYWVYREKMEFFKVVN